MISGFNATLIKGGLRPLFRRGWIPRAVRHASSEWQNTVCAEFTPEAAVHGQSAEVKLFVDGQPTGAGCVEKTLSVGDGAEGLDIGADNISAVSPSQRLECVRCGWNAMRP